VEQLVLDGAREYSADALREALGVEGARADAPPAELLVEKAIRTGATVTPVEGEAAERLAEHGGVAAILRY
jgi:hypothetical protein